jgi:hypothetical protein
MEIKKWSRKGNARGLLQNIPWGANGTILEKLIRESRPKIRCNMQVDLRWVSEKSQQDRIHCRALTYTETKLQAPRTWVIS